MIELWVFLGAASLFVMACVQVTEAFSHSKDAALVTAHQDLMRRSTEAQETKSLEWQKHNEWHAILEADVKRHLDRHALPSVQSERLA